MAARAKYVPIYESVWIALKGMTEEERLRAYDSLCEYAFEGLVPDFSDQPLLSLFWELTRPNIDAALRRSEVNRRNIGRRWENRQDGE